MRAKGLHSNIHIKFYNRAHVVKTWNIQLKHTNNSGGSDSRQMLQHHRYDMTARDDVSEKDDVSSRAFFRVLLLFFKALRLIWFSFLDLRNINPRVLHGIDESYGKIFALGSNSCRYQNPLIHFWYTLTSHTNSKR